MSKPKLTSANLIETTLSSQVAYNGPFLKVQQERVKSPDGVERIREFIHHPGAAIIIPVLSDGSLLLIQQYRHALRKIFWEFPAGKIDAGETPEQTAVRELKEEVGATALEMKWLTSIHPVIGYADEHIELYLARGLTFGETHWDSGELMIPESKTLPELLTMIRHHEVTDVKTQLAIFWYEKFVRGEWT